MENSRSTEVSVVSVTGDVIVVNAQGEERIVKAGEAILPGEMIITPADGEVSLNTGKTEPEAVPADTAAFLEIDPETGEVVLVFQAVENEGLDIAAIQEAILQGQDPTEILESAAAGQISREGFSSFQMVARTADEVIAEAGYDTSSDPREFDEIPTFDGEDRPARPDIGIPDLNGSLVGSNSIAENASAPVSGSFVLNAPGGVRDITVDGNVITEQQLLDLQSGAGTIPPITTSDESGILTITDYDSATGTVTYSYQVSGTKDHSAGDSSVVDNISLLLTDNFGQPSPASSLDVLITDTVPDAIDDSANTAEDTAVTVNVLTNDDLGADGSQVVGATVPVSQGTVTYTGTSITFTPAPGFEGDATVTYTIRDADGDTDSANAVITVAPDSTPTITITPPTTGTDPDAPDAGDANVVHEQGLRSSSDADTSNITSGSFTVSSGNDSIASLTVAGQQLVGSSYPITITTGLGNTLTITGYNAGTGVVSYTYEVVAVETHADANGNNTLQESFPVAVEDSDGDTASDSLSIVIVDDVPTAADDAANTAEDTPITVNVLANDTQGADGAQVVGATVPAAQGTVTFNGTSITFTPAAGFEGDATVTYTIRDADGDTDSADAVITVAADSTPTISIDPPDRGGNNDAPDAGDVNVVHEQGLRSSSDADTSNVISDTFTVTSGNDSIASLTVSGQQVVGASYPITITSGLGNTLTITGYNAGTGVVSYTYEVVATETHANGAGNNSLLESFLVAVQDSDGDTASDSLSILIIDDVPKAEHDATTTAEDTPVTVNVLANDTQGADGASVTAASVPAAEGSLTFNGTSVTFTPAPGFSGPATISYTITDGDGDTSSAQLVVTVGADSVPTILIDPPNRGNDNDAPDGADVNVVHEQGLRSSSDADTSNITSGTFTVTSGNDSIASLTVAGQQVVGASYPITITTGLGNTLTITGFNAGTGVVSYTYEVVAVETHANAAGNNSLLESFAVAVEDSDGDTASDSLSILIIDDVPTAVDDAANTAEDTPVTVNVLANDTQGADGAQVIGATVPAAQGTVTFNGTSITFTPAAGFEGDATVTYTIRDADGDTDSADAVITVAADSTPTITVTPPTTGTDPDAPDAGDANVVHEQGLRSSSDADTSNITSGSFTVSSGNDSIASLTVAGQQLVGGSYPITITTGLGNTLTITGYNAGSGVVNYTYEVVAAETHADANGNNTLQENFPIAVQDSDGDNASDNLSIIIVDDVPTAADDAANTAEDAPVTVNVLANDTQGADGAQVVGATVPVAQGTVTFNGTSITFTPAAGFEGDATVTYTIRDADGDTDSADAVITVAADSTPTISIDPPDRGGNNDAPDAGDVNVAHEQGLRSSSDADTSNVISDTFTVTSGNDSIASLTVSGQELVGASYPITITSALGNTLTITGYNAGTGVVNYTYEVVATETHANAAGNNSLLESFPVAVEDSDGDTASDSLSILIIDDVPKAEHDVTTTAEDTPVTVNVLANDTQGADGASVTAASVPASEGTLTFNGTSVTFTPVPGFSGPATISYTITDGDGDTSSAQLVVTVGADSVPTILIDPPNRGNDNDAPDGADVNVVHEQGLRSSSDADTSNITSGTFTVTSGSDSIASLTVAGQQLVGGSYPITITTGLGNTLTITGYNAGTGVVSYTYEVVAAETHANAAGNNSLLESFAVAVEDSDGDTASDSLSILIIDDVPTAVDDAANTAEDTPVTVNVLANDTQGADGAQVVGATVPVAQGTVTFNGTSITFTPAAGFEGDATVTYTIRDADGDTDSADAVITVAADSTPTITVTPPTTGTDPDAPDAGDANVVHEQGLRSSSDADTSNITSGSFTVSSGNDSIASLTIAGQQLVGGSYPITITTGLGNTLTITGYNAGSGVVNYTYEVVAAETHANANGNNTLQESFPIAVQDSDGDNASDSLSIIIVDDVPTAADDAANTAEDTPITVNVLANDTQGADGAQVVGATVPVAQGTVTFNGTSITFTPAAGFEGDATVTYTIRDADGDTDSADAVITVAADSTPTITVTPPTTGTDPDAPDAGDANVVHEQGLRSGSDADTSNITSGSFTVNSGNDSIASLTVAGEQLVGGSYPITITTGLGNTLTITGYNAGSGVVNYTYEVVAAETHANANGNNTLQESFPIAVQDSDGDNASDSLSIIIVDDVPTAADDAANTAEDTPITVNVLANDTQGADGAQVVGATVPVAQGTVTFNGTSITFTPAAGFEGDATVTYTIRDADGDTDSADAVITVAADSTPTITVTPPTTGTDPDAPDAGDANVVHEQGLRSGSDADTSNITSGSFTVNSGNDSIASLTVAGQQLVGGSYPITITTGLGNTLTITGYNAGSGVVNYTYEVVAAETHADANGNNTLQESFPIAVQDSDGDNASDSLSIIIVDDVPTAADDAANTAEDTPITVNVLANDTQGADGAQVVGATVPVAQGTVTFNGTSITFTPAAGFEGDATVTYTIRDADGDTDSADAVITVAADSTPTITVTPPTTGTDPDAPDAGDANVVHEQGLRSGSDADTSNITSGSFTVNSGNDSIASLTIAGEQLVGGSYPITITTGLGNTLTITGYNAGSGVVNYTYEVVAAETHANANGNNTLQESFPIAVQDSDGDNASDSLSIIIVDDVPTAADDAANTAEDTPITVNVLANDTQGADGAQVVGATVPVAQGTVTFNGTSITFTPAAGFEGDATVTYTIRDADGDTDSADAVITVAADSTPTITVTPPTTGTDPDAPDAGDANVVHEQGLRSGSDADTSNITSDSFTVNSGNDSIASLTIAGEQLVGGSYPITITTGLGNTLTITGYNAGSGVVNYTYEVVAAETHANANGNNTLQESFPIAVQDSDGDNASDSLSIIIVDDVPTAADDAANTAEDTPITVNVLANDTQGADGASVTAASVPASEGTLTFNGTSVTFTPVAGFSGPATISYTITDGDGDTSSAQLVVTVGADSVPTILIDPPNRGNDNDAPDGADVNVVHEQGLRSSSDADTSNITSGTFTVTSGSDSIASLTVAGEQLVGGSYPITITTGLGNTLTITGFNAGTGVVSYTYEVVAVETHANAAGNNSLLESFAVAVEDSDGDTASDSLSILIVDDVPTAADDAANTAEDAPITVNVLANDTQGADGAQVIGATVPVAQGTVTFNGTSITFTPAAGFEGDATVMYTIRDADGDTDSADAVITVAADSTPTITVTPPTTGTDPDAPDAGDANVVHEQGLRSGSDADTSNITSGSFTVNSGNDSIASLTIAGEQLVGGSYPITITTGLGNTLTITGYNAGSGVVNYTYEVVAAETHANANGNNTLQESFPIAVQDSDGDNASDSLSIIIVDDVPTAADDAANTAEDTPITVNVLANDTQGADGAQVVGATVPVAQGTVTFNGTSITFTPAAGFEGDATVTYTIRDADGDTDSADAVITVAADSTPTITVTPPTTGTDPDAPDAGDANVVHEQGLRSGSDADTSNITSGSFTVNSGNDSIASLTVAGEQLVGGSYPITITTGLGNTLTITGYNAGSGVVNYTYEVVAAETHANANGNNTLQESFPIAVQDSDGDNASDSLSIIIVDDVPTAADDAANTAEDTPITVNVLANDTQGADGAQVVGATVPVAQGTVTFNGTSITFTPAAGFEGDATVTYTIRDADGDTDSADAVITVAADSTPTITVTPPTTGTDPDAPDAGDANVVHEQGLRSGSDADTSNITSGSFTVNSGNDSIASLTVAGQQLVGGSYPITITTGLGNTLTITGYNAGSGVVNYTYEVVAAETHANAAGNNSLLESFPVAVEDSDGDTASDSLSILIIDDVPTAVDDAANTAEDAPVTVNVLANDTQGADGAQVIGATVSVAQGTVTFNGTSITFTPAAGFEGDATVTYTIRDADGDTDSADAVITVAADSTPTITVTPPTTGTDPDAPDAGDANVVHEQGLRSGSDADTSNITSGSFTVNSGNDSIASLTIAGEQLVGGSYPITITTGLGNTLTITGYNAGSGVVNYTYEVVAAETHANANGNNTLQESFPIAVQDSDGDNASDSLSIIIVDDVPTAADDAANTAEDTPITVNVLANDTQGADGAQVVGATVPVAQGTVTFNGTSITFTPAAGFEGDATVTYTIRDADGDTDSADAVITVAADSTPTITVTPPTTGTDPDAPDAGDANVVHEQGLRSSSDADTSNITSGSFTVNSGNDSIASLTIAGEQLVGGSYPITITTGLGNTLTITGYNAGSGVVNYTYEVVAAETHANANGNNTLQESFPIAVQDSDGDNASDNLSIIIVDDVPTAADDVASTAEDTPITVNVLANDTQGADGAQVIGATVPAAQGTVTFNGTSITFTPASNFNGTATISYTIRDADGDTSSADAVITVTPVNDKPTTQDGDVTTLEDTAYQFQASDFAFADVDSGDSLQQVRIDSLPDDGVLLYNGVEITAANLATFNSGSNAIDIADIGNLTFRPAEHESGYDNHNSAGEGDQKNDYDSFQFSVSDGTDWSDPATISVDVTPDADAPTLVVNGTQDTNGNDLADLIVVPASVGLKQTIHTAVSTKSPQVDLNDTINGDQLETIADGISGSTTTTETQPYPGGNSPSSNLAVDSIHVTEGLIYLEQGTTISFSGYSDDALLIDLGGNTLLSTTGDSYGVYNSANSGTSSNGAGTETGAGVFTVPATGYYTFEMYAYNHGGPGDLSVNVSINGQPATPLNTSNLTIYPDIGAVDSADGQHSALVPTSGTDGGYYPSLLNQGQEKTPIKLTGISAALVDTDGSEELGTGLGADTANAADNPNQVVISEIPVGSILTDGTNTFTATAGNTSVDVSQWNLNNLFYEAEVSASSEVHSLKVTANTIEIADGNVVDTASTETTLDITVFNNGPTITIDPPNTGSNPGAPDAGDVNVVHEQGLRSGSDADNSDSVTASFTVTSTNDSITSLTVAGQQLVGGSFPIVVNTPLGNRLTINSYNSSTGEVNYTYEVVAAETHADGAGNNTLQESFAVVATDSDGDSSTDSLAIQIVDDVPTGADDVANTAEDTQVTVNVLANDTQGADGAQVVGATVPSAQGSVSVTATSIIFTPAAGFEGDATITYTIRDADGDTDTADAVITVAADSTPTIIITPPNTGTDPDAPDGGDVNVVHEQGLRSNSDSDESNILSGTFSVDAGNDSIGSITIEGQQIVGAGFPVEITSGLGNKLTVTGYNASTGVVSYTYEVLAAETHANGNGNNTLQENFAVVVQDNDPTPDSANGTLSIQIVDDVPAANTDLFKISEGYVSDPNTGTGHVITGAAGTGVDNTGAVADVAGADGGLVVTGVRSGSHLGQEVTGGVSNTVSIAGTYGNLILNAQGAFEYIPNANDSLGAGQKATDVFTYTVKDADGDYSTALLQVEITGTNDVPQITNTQSAVVSEEGLPGGTPDGSGSDSRVFNGTYTASDVDTGDSLTATLTGLTGVTGLQSGGNDVTFTGTGTKVIIGSAGGEEVLRVEIRDNGTYTVTLSKPLDHSGDSLNIGVNYQVADNSGATATSSISITVEDDTPIARTDIFGISESNSLFLATGNVITAAAGSGVDGSRAAADSVGADGGGSVTGIRSGSHLGQEVTGGVGGSSSIPGTFGTLAMTASGAFVYFPGANNQLREGQKVTDTFTYTIKDADGDYSTALLQVEITGTNDDPTITTTSNLTISEDGLPGANPDGVGSDSATAAGNYTVTDPDAVDTYTAVLTGVTGVTGLESGGQAVTFSGADSKTMIGSAGGQEVIRIEITDSGSYTVTLSGPLDHDTFSGNIGVNFRVTDSAGGTDNNSFNVAVEDDTPIVQDSIAGLGFQPIVTNLTLIIDSSGSMSSTASGTSISRMQLAINAAKALVAEFKSFGDVNVQIYEFDTNTVRTLTWNNDLNTINNSLDALNNTVGGGTDYAQSIDAVRTSYTNVPTNADQSYVYFMSDGNPNTNSRRAAALAAEDRWKTFIDGNNIDGAFAIGMGNNVADDYLDAVAYDPQNDTNNGSGLDPNTRIVTNGNQLVTELLGTVIQKGEGSLFGSANSAIKLGADGATVETVTIFGNTYTTSSPEFDAVAQMWTITNSDGRKFTLDRDSGDYTYEVPRSVKSTLGDTYDENIEITAKDSDTNTTSTGDLVIKVDFVNADVTITGTSSAEVLIGGLGDDTITSGGGDDILTGGAGDDILIGGTGADTFNWDNGHQATTGVAQDTVRNFNASQDKLDLSDMLEGMGLGDNPTLGVVEQYLSITEDSGNVKLSVKAGSSASVSQEIVLENVSVAQLKQDVGLDSSANNSQLLDELIKDSNLIV